MRISEISLNPDPGKKYFNSERAFHDEVIYFIMVDRFHDGKDRDVINYPGFLQDQKMLKTFCGGTLRGITKQLDYISELGCTSIWISPVFENNDGCYHGYAIENFLKIDSHFGTIEDLIDLVKEAHERNMRVILDCVINHSGNNWYYKSTEEENFSGTIHTPGGWRKENIPLPSELRNFGLYEKRGAITDWDNEEQLKTGDFYELKKFLNDGSVHAKEILDLLIKIYCYWIKEADLDGLRLDAIKHMTPESVHEFCDSIRSYCQTLGKDNFFIFGEVSGEYEEYFSYSKGISHFIDFPLFHNIPEVLKRNRYGKNWKSFFRHRNTKISEGLGLITFADNHDQPGYVYKKRFASGLSTQALLSSYKLFLTLPGIPCIYYGSEQGFQGEGLHDSLIREAMFDLKSNHSFHNRRSEVYLEIAAFLKWRNTRDLLKTGTVEVCRVTAVGKGSKVNPGKAIVLKVSNGKEILYLFLNQTDTIMDLMVELEPNAGKLISVYGSDELHEVKTEVRRNRKISYITCQLQPFQFVIKE